MVLPRDRHLLAASSPMPSLVAGGSSGASRGGMSSFIVCPCCVLERCGCSGSQGRDCHAEPKARSPGHRPPPSETRRDWLGELPIAGTTSGCSASYRTCRASPPRIARSPRRPRRTARSHTEVRAADHWGSTCRRGARGPGGARLDFRRKQSVHGTHDEPGPRVPAARPACLHRSLSRLRRGSSRLARRRRRVPLHRPGGRRGPRPLRQLPTGGRAGAAVARDGREVGVPTSSGRRSPDMARRHAVTYLSAMWSGVAACSHRRTECSPVR